MGFRIAVISDIHANASALSKIIAKVANDSFDVTIFLGDILTYGVEPIEVLDLLNDYRARFKTIFIVGNHDQLYFDLQSKGGESRYEITGFVKESVEWTLEQIRLFDLVDIFDWVYEEEILGILFAHANPFGIMNWRYVEDPMSVSDAVKILSNRGLLGGVFGHTHRQYFCSKNKGLIFSGNIELDTSSAGEIPFIINAGSTGQPRGRGLGYAALDIEDKHMCASFISLDFNFDLYKAKMHSTSLSIDTKRKLIGFLR